MLRLKIHSQEVVGSIDPALYWMDAIKAASHYIEKNKSIIMGYAKEEKYLQMLLIKICKTRNHLTENI